MQESPVEMDLQIVIGEPIRDPILDILVPAAGELPRLDQPAADLEKIVREALLAIGCRPAAIEIISRGEYERLGSRLSEDAKRFIRLTPGDAIDRSINWLMGSAFPDMISDRYGERLETMLGAARFDKLGTTLWGDVVLAHHAEGRRKFGALADRMLYTIYACLKFQMGFDMAKMRDLSAIMEKFSWLCVIGNYPIGFLSDRTFLVLTS